MSNKLILVTVLISAMLICFASSLINVPNSLNYSPMKSKWRLFQPGKTNLKFYNRQPHKRSISSSFNEEDGGTCYEDCLSEVYNGIRSADGDGTKCLKWSKKNNKYSKLKSNFCTMKDSSTNNSWCAVPEYQYYNNENKIKTNDWQFCKIPRCNSKKKFIGCVRNIHLSSTSQSITGNWSSPSEVSSNNNLVGYLILLHNNEGECLQYIIQVNETYQFSITVRNFYITCWKEAGTKNIYSSFQFSNLDINTQYSVYIIPIIDTENVGLVKNITITTKLAMPHRVTEVQLRRRGRNALFCNWKKSERNRFHDVASFYLLNLISENGAIISRNTTENSIIFDNLNQCTKYCVYISAGNNAGRSAVSKKVCAVTKYPVLGQVTVSKVKYEYGRRKLVSWQYMGSDRCPKQYKVEYRPQGNSVSYKTIRTNDTNLVLTNLIPNTMYKLRVSAIGDVEDFPSVSNFTNMYTGNSKISVTDFNHHFNSSRKQLLIAWQLKNEDVGAVLMFYVEITNSSGYCVASSKVMYKDFATRIPSKHITKDINNNNNNNCNVTSQTRVYGNVNKITTKLPWHKQDPHYTLRLYGYTVLGWQLIAEVSMSYGNSSPIIIILLILLIVVVFVISVVAIYSKWDRISAFITVPIERLRTIVTTDQSTDQNIYMEMIQNESSSAAVTATAYNVAVHKFEDYMKIATNNNNDLLRKQFMGIETEIESLNLTSKFINEQGGSAAIISGQRKVIFPETSSSANSINAVWLSLPGGNNDKYICSQNPTNRNVNEFWLLLWQQKVSGIVMMADGFSEEANATYKQYWPCESRKGQHWGYKNEYKVDLVEVKQQFCWIERKLRVQNLLMNETRTIHQLEIQKFYDESITSLNNFDKFIDNIKNLFITTINWPLLVHFSGEADDIGTFIVAEYIVRQLRKRPQYINIRDTVLNLKQSHPIILQNENKYFFIHKYIGHYLKMYNNNNDVIYDDGE